MLKPRINKQNFPDFTKILEVRKEFDVSLTGLLVRWTQLSDFPCATIATHNGQIKFGWVSEAFRKIGCYRVDRGHVPECSYFRRFVKRNSPVTRYEQSDGAGGTEYWLRYDKRSFETEEFYFTIPHSGLIWVFLVCDENDFDCD